MENQYTHCTESLNLHFIYNIKGKIYYIEIIKRVGTDRLIK